MSDFFRQKFESKSNIELEEIVKNNIKFILEARIAAITILKERNYESAYLKMLEDDLQTEKSRIQLESKNLQNENKNIIRILETISIKDSKKYKLNNWQELCIKRLNKKKYEIRIDHSKSFFSPIIICDIKNGNQIKYFPFFNINSTSILFITSILVLGYSYFTYESISAKILFILSLILSFFITIQILLFPIMYRLILNTFKKEIKNKNVS